MDFQDLWSSRRFCEMGYSPGAWGNYLGDGDGLMDSSAVLDKAYLMPRKHKPFSAPFPVTLLLKNCCTPLTCQQNLTRYLGCTPYGVLKSRLTTSLVPGGAITSYSAPPQANSRVINRPADLPRPLNCFSIHPYVLVIRSNDRTAQHVFSNERTLQQAPHDCPAHAGEVS